MTSLLAPGLITGSAPPANGPPDGHLSGSTGGAPDPTSPFAQLLAAARAVMQGGETATPPEGGTPSSSEPGPTPADLLAALMALVQGAKPPDEGSPESAETDLSLLDRPAGAGEDHIKDGPAMEPGAAEALMALLAYGAVGAPLSRTDAPETAMPSLDADAHDLAVALEMAARAAIAQGTEVSATSGGAGPQSGSQPAPISPAVQAAVEQVLRDAGVTPGPDALAPADAVAATPPSEASGDVTASALPTTETAGSLAAPEGGTASTSVTQPAVPEQPPSSPAGMTAQVETEAQPALPAADRDLGQPFASTVGASQQFVANPAAAPQAAGPTGAAEAVSAAQRVDAAALPTALVDTVQSAVLRGDSEVRLVLNPPELGHLDIRIATHEGGLRVVLEAAQSGARDLLERALPSLQQGLEARDLRVDRLEVRATDTGRGSLDSGSTGQQSGDGQAGTGDGRPEWSAVASLGLGDAGQAGAVTPSQQTAGDGRLDVMA